MPSLANEAQPCSHPSTALRMLCTEVWLLQKEASVNMWEIIYRAIRALVLIGLLAAIAVLAQVVLGGPLWVWLVVMAGLASGTAFAWRRSGGALLQSLLKPSLAGAADPMPIAVPSEQTADVLPALPNVVGKLSMLSQGFFQRLESEPSASASALNIINTARSNQTVWHMPLAQALFFVSLGLAVFAAIGLRLFKLDALQTEVYGDINIVHEYLFAIRDGEWPFEFILSSGPLYHYLIYPLVSLLGQGYSSIKVASVITSLFALLFTYLVSRRLLNDWFALIALFVAGVSSWLLVFSRLGNSQILLPLLTLLSLWLLLRFRQTKTNRALILSAITATLGLYVYPQSFPLPLAMLLVLVVFKLSDKGIGWLDVLLFCGTVLLVAAPFPFIVSESMLSVNKYILPKLTDSVSPGTTLLINILNAVMAFHIQGDRTFRSNPTGQPHLDPISGILMVIGFVFWLRRDRVLSLALLIPFVLLQVPSVLVLTNMLETPSASRTLGAAPIAYIWVASGLWWALQALRKRAGLGSAVGVGLIGLLAILGWNAYRYFDSYLNGLPYQNTAIARHIQTYADTLAPDTHVYMVGCCWEGGMPEPKSISFEMQRPDNLQYVDPQTLTCESLRISYVPGSVFVWAYSAPAPSIAVEAGACMGLLPNQTIFSEKGLPMYHLGWLQTNALNTALASPLPVPPPTAGELPGQLVTLDGGEVEIRHSPLDIGTLQDALDGNVATLMRGESANPFFIDLTFQEPRTFSGIALTLGSMADVIFHATFVLEDGTFSDATVESTVLPPDPRVEIKLADGAQTVTQVHIEILDRRPPPGEGFHTHIREIELLP